MDQTFPDALDFTQTWLSLAIDVAQALDLSDAQSRCAVALAAIVPECRFEVAWNVAEHPCPLIGAGQLALPLPDASDHQRLHAGLPVPPIRDRPGYLPLRVRGKLCGWLCVESAAWSADQTQALVTLSATLAPTIIMLDSRIQVETAQQRQWLTAAAHRLRGVLQFDALLQQLYRITHRLLDTSNLFLALYYENSDWLELAYLVEAGQLRNQRQFWRPNTGLTGIIVRTRAPIRTDDYYRECQQRGAPALRGPDIDFHAWMAVPLLVQNQVIGALGVFQTGPGRTYTDQEAVLLQDLATEAALAIQNARLYTRAERQAHQLAALNRISHVITSTLDPERVPSLIMQQTQELLDVEEGSLLLLDEQSGDLVFSYASGPAGHQLLGQHLPKGVGIAGYVVSSGQSAIVNDTSQDGRFYPDTDDKTGFVTRSLLAVPLCGIGGVQGVIEVLNKHSGAPFIEEDRRLLEAVAVQAVIALENAQRFAQVDQALARRARELDRSNNQLREILRVGNALRAEQRLDELLGQIAQATSKSTGFRSAVIALVQRERTVQPYLQRVAAAGSAAESIERISRARVPIERLQALLRPEFRRGSATYFIDHRHDDYLQLWGDRDQHYIPDLPPPQPGGWHACDTLFSLLRNRQGELLGLLRVDEPEDGMHPTPEQVQILEIFANQAAVAIENARLYAEQQHSLRSMVALNGLGMAINSTLRSVEQIFELTASGLIETTAAQNAVVLLAEDTPEATADSQLPATSQPGYTLRPVFYLGSPPGDHTLITNLAHQAMHSRRPVTSQLHTASKAQPDRPPEFWVVIPLRATQRSLGAICVSYRDGFPSTADLETLSLFASQAAVAIENIRLFSAVREGRDQLASIMASTKEGMMLVTGDGKIAVVNSAFQKLVGIPTQPPPTLPQLNDFLKRWETTSSYPADEWQALRAGLMAVTSRATELAQGQLTQSTPTARALEWTALRVAGEAHDDREGTEDQPGLQPVRRSGDAPQPSGAVLPLLLVLRDITAAKETERLRQDLTSMIVHDLRSPLTSIMTSIDMIIKGLIGNINPRQDEVLRIAFASAETLLNMVNMMLDISRLEEGHMPLERAPLSVDKLVYRAIERLKSIARKNNIRIEVNLPDSLASVYADSGLILRVIQNLLDNAMKFSKRDSSITIQAWETPPPLDATLKIIEVAASNDKTFVVYPTRFVTIAVRDYGSGIPANEREKIFARFGQVSKRRRGGTGLGLTFCKLVVEAHGGQIWVESETGQGSTFVFTLPTVAALPATRKLSGTPPVI